MSTPRRQTRQGKAIHAVIREAGRPLAPAEILELATPRVASLSQATVYRQVRRLLDEGAIREIVLPGSPARYEDAGASGTPEAADVGAGAGAGDGSAAAARPATVRGAAASSGAHHHFFHCEQCDAVFPVEGCAGDVEQLAPAAFRVRRHEVVLYGECARCVDEATPDDPASGQSAG